MTRVYAGHTTTKANADLDVIIGSVTAANAARVAGDAATLATANANITTETNARIAGDATETAARIAGDAATLAAAFVAAAGVTLTQVAQPNVTSLGILTALRLAGLLTVNSRSPFFTLVPTTAIVNGVAGTNKEFRWSSNEFPNTVVARKNWVVEVGHNISGGGALIDGTDDGFRDAWESHFESVPGTFLMERHIAFVPHDLSGEIRAFTAFMNKGTKEVGVAMRTDSFTLTRSLTNEPHWQWSGKDLSLVSSATLSPNVYVNKNNYATYQQLNAAGNAFIQLPYINAASETAIANDTGVAVISGLGVQGVLRVQGTATGNKQPIVSLYTNGTYQSVISQDATRLFVGAPNGTIADYNDATVKAFASLSVSNAGVIIVRSTGGLRWASTANVDTGAVDITLARSGASTLALTGSLSVSAALTLAALGGGGGAVSVGAADSGGVGFRLLRVPN